MPVSAWELGDYARSNWFRVRNKDTFREVIDALEHDIDVVDGTGPHLAGKVCMVGQPAYSEYTWPSTISRKSEYTLRKLGVIDAVYERYPYASPSREPWTDMFPFHLVVALHLADGEVAVMMNIGADLNDPDRWRLDGEAFAIANDGSGATVFLDTYKFLREHFPRSADIRWG